MGSSLAQTAISSGNVAQGVGILAGQNTFSALAAAGIRASNPSFGYDQLFDTRAAALAPQAESICSDALGNVFAQDIQSYLQAGGTIANYAGVKANFAQNTTIHNFLASAEPGTVKINAPVLIVQGDADTTVPKVATDALVQQMQGLGSDVTYDIQTGQTHTGALSSAMNDIFAFIKTRMASS
jgi:pimeloyl-ACP methyl ester carboxylesterase